MDGVKHHFKLIGEKKSTKTGFVASSGGGGPPIIFQIIDYSLLPSSLVTRDKRDLKDECLPGYHLEDSSVVSHAHNPAARG